MCHTIQIQIQIYVYWYKVYNSKPILNLHFIVEVILNNVCIAGQSSDQCSDVQVECVTDSVFGSLKCSCKTGYYENSGSVCAQSKLSFFTETNLNKLNICFGN